MFLEQLYHLFGHIISTGLGNHIDVLIFELDDVWQCDCVMLYLHDSYSSHHWNLVEQIQTPVEWRIEHMECSCRRMESIFWKHTINVQCK